MALSFLHIGKANSRIKELEGQVTTLTKERDDALSAVEANASEVTKSAEELQTQLTAATKEVSRLAGELTSCTTMRETHAATIKSLEAQLAAKDKEVEVKISRGVAQTQAALGQPAIPAIPAAATAAAATNGKTGMARVLASAKADLEAAGYVRKTN